MTRIIIDAMGADNGSAMVAEALLAARSERDFEAVIIGPEAIIRSVIGDCGGIEVIDTEEFIANDEHPVMAIRRKKTASIVLGLNRLNEDGDALVSAGSTGALLAGGYFITKRLEGIERCALAAPIPHPNGTTILLDCGATMDTTPDILLQFARLGDAYARKTMRIEHPRIGLLNVGTEPGKGDKRSGETYELLAASGLNFVGNIEARAMLDGACDVLVTDGFSGNIALKTLEGTAKTLMSGMRQALQSSIKTKLGALLIKSELKAMLGAYDYKAYGGAPLLGARKPIYKAHGNSTVQTFKLAILEALVYAEAGVEADITRQLSEGE